MAKSDTEGGAAAPQPKKKKSKLLIIVSAFVLLMGVGAGAWWYFNQSLQAAGDGTEEAPARPSTPPGLLALDPFVVNLADIGGRKYLRVAMVLQLKTVAAAKEAEENKLTMSRLRSAIIEVLTTRTAMQLATADGRTELKKAVADTVKQVAHTEVTDVLLEEFIIQ